MTTLEKIEQIKDFLQFECRYGDGCADCKFFDAEDDTDGDFFCAIRDRENRKPADFDWSIISALVDIRRTENTRENCKHIGKEENEEPCCGCLHNETEIEPYRNADRIRHMSDDELARFLCVIAWEPNEYEECLEWLKGVVFG